MVCKFDKSSPFAPGTTSRQWKLECSRNFGRKTEKKLNDQNSAKTQRKRFPFSIKESERKLRALPKNLNLCRTVMIQLKIKIGL